MSVGNARVADRFGSPGRSLVSTRLLRSELWLIFGRRRNWAGLATLAAVPIIIAVALKIWPVDGTGGSNDLFGRVTENGLFVALAALTYELPLFLPLAIAAIAADSIAGEANLGTLRYLLVVPVHRTRILAVKYAALVVFAFAAVLVVSVTGMLFGLALFGGGSAVSLSGTELPFGAMLLRILLISGYLGIMMAGFAAMGLFISTLTEQPIGGTIAAMVVMVISAVLTAIPMLTSIHPYLFTNHWMAYTELLRDPVTFSGPLRDGMLNAAGYTLVFLTAAWARFAGRDVTS